MIDISFVQSELQLSIASTVTPESQIICIRRSIRYRIYDTFLAFTQMLVALSKQKTIAVYDHRNPLVLIAAAICKMFPSQFDYVFVGDDGLHSLIVDKHQHKYLYWRTRVLKAFLLKKLQSEVLSLKRLHSLKDMRAYSADGSIFLDYYGRLGKFETLLGRSAVFIDQPAVVDCMNAQEIAHLSDKLREYNDVEVILHPRRKNNSLYLELGFSSRLSSNIDVELNTLDETVEVIGYFSTVLLASKRYGHTIKTLEIPVAFEGGLRDYASACVEIINDTHIG